MSKYEQLIKEKEEKKRLQELANAKDEQKEIRSDIKGMID